MERSKAEIMGHRMAESEFDAGALTALFRGKRTHNSRRYTLERIEGLLVFRLSGFDAVFESALNESFGQVPDAEDYNTLVVTDGTPKRFYDSANDRARLATVDSRWEFFGRS
jgi:hypothetical protein